ncbi:MULTISPECIES: hypothetical protein [Bacillus subtilis group]|uniref:hypothetical protein n=1 Tax=Bacillus subtilis group TaxID=653685 RepID=UPI0011AA20F5|nr:MULTISPECIES: hypothetical protein [Bacillus subtilis group]MED1128847.1 hypothetical protein [Bacillus paralicheniformis]TWL69398.1 hypothetical protein CHCC15318_2140 [Bacillus licheniformis]TWM26923.1 hypothetical protein CHCC14821_3037 [Bacillus paralicheniformis]
MKNIDVNSLAQELEEQLSKDLPIEVSKIIDSQKGKAMDTKQFFNEIVVPVIGTVSAMNRRYTINLIQKVVDELNSDH